MSALLSSDETHGILHISFQGPIGDEDAIKLYTRIAAWFATHGYRSNITDFTGVTSFTVSARTVTALAAKVPLVPNGFQRIMVAPQDTVFGSARMYEMLGSGTRDNVQVVRTLGEACKLLQVESLDLKPIDKW
jgi:hypothetical protein